jgi:CRP-like cAMP-binding protein
MHGNADIWVGDVVESGPGASSERWPSSTRKRSATVLARTECQLVPISIKRFHFLVEQTPQFATYVMRIMANRLRRMDSKVLGIEKGENAD